MKYSDDLGGLYHTTGYTYDALDRMSTISYPDGGSVTYGYDAAGNKTHEIITMDTGKTQLIRYVYDNVGRVKEIWRNPTVTNPDTVSTAHPSTLFGMVQVQAFTYDANGNKTTEENFLLGGVKTEWDYDAMNRVTTVTTNPDDPESEMQAITSYIYYRTGWKKLVTDPNTNAVGYEYYLNGKVKKELLPNGGYTEYDYDDAGNNTAKRILTDTGVTSSTSYGYNGRNLMKSMTDGCTKTWNYAYDYVGNLASMTSPKNQTYWYTYDAMNRLRSTKGPDLLTEWKYYDLAGNLKTVINLNGQTINYSYDSMKRLTGTTGPGVTVSYTYDKVGNRLSMTDGTGTTTYSYDLLNRLLSVISNGKEIRYEYDDANNIKWMQDPHHGAGARTKYEFDALGRLKMVTDPDSRTAIYEYDQGGCKKSVTLSTGQVTNYLYTVTNAIEKVTTTKAGGALLDQYGYDYTYYPDGNLKTMTDSTGTTSYTYDDAGRLHTVTEPGNVVTTYEYDDAGNRTSMTKTGLGTVTYNYDPATNDGKRERLTSILLPNNETISFTYDANGNQKTVTKGGVTTTYTYDSLNQLTGISRTGLNASFTYDGDGKRRSKTVGTETTTFLYDGVNLLLELNQAGTYTNHYIYGTNLLAMDRLQGSGGYTSYIYNGHGDVVGLLGADGTTVKNSVNLDEFGNPEIGTDRVTANNGTFETVPTGRLYGDPALDNASVRMYYGSVWWAGMNYCPSTEYCEIADVTGASSGTRVARFYDTGANKWKAVMLLNKPNLVPGKWYRASVKARVIEGNGTKYAAAYLSWNTNDFNGDKYVTKFVTWTASEMASGDWVEKYVIFYVPLGYTNLSVSPFLYGHYGGAGIVEYDDYRLEEFDAQPSGPPAVYNETAPNNFLYSIGQGGYYYFDRETELYYCGARYYDPEIGRFINEDPIRDGLNWYIYARNNPLKYIDPDGREAQPLDWVQTGLDAVGLIPGVGEFADGVNGLISLARGDAIGAGLSFAAMIPIAGWGATSTKVVLKYGDEAMAVGRNVNNATGAIPAGVCFTEDTEVYTEDGHIPIKEIKVGDKVHSFDPDSGEKGIKRVSNVFVNETNVLVHILVGTEELKTTLEHPFWVVGKGWVNAEDLHINDQLFLYTEGCQSVSEIWVEELTEPIKVYNFEVEDWHTYFVSNEFVLVHNSCMAPTPNIFNKAGQAYPTIIDPRTGKNIPFPEGNLQKVPKEKRVEWNNQTRAEFIKEWYDRGYQTPPGGWDKYDIHHIKPREYGGTNDFENLVPVERNLHQDLFNPFWIGF